MPETVEKCPPLPTVDVAPDYSNCGMISLYFREYGSGIVRGSIIHNNTFDIFVGLSDNRLCRLRQKAPVIVVVDNDADDGKRQVDQYTSERL